MDTANETTNQISVQSAFYDWLEENAKGLTKTQASYALFDAGQNPTGLDIAHFWNQKNKKEDDVITLDELEELNSRLGDPKEVMKKALKYFDKDNNGKIDREELREILRLTDQLESGVDEDDEYVDSLLKLGDKNGDKMLDIDELVTMIQDGLLTF